MTDVTASIATPRKSSAMTIKARMERRYVVNLIDVLRPHSQGLRRWSVMRAMRSRWEDADLPVSQKFEDDVERAFRRLCAGADAFKNGPSGDDEAVFYRPGERAGEVWAVHEEQADVWLATDGADID